MSRNFFNTIIQSIKPNLSINSKVQYTSVFIKLFPNVEQNEDRLKSALSKEAVKELITKIENDYTSASSRGFRYNALILLVKHYYGENDERYILLSQKRDECNQKYLKKAEAGLNTEQKSNMVTTEEYENMIKSWKPHIKVLIEKEAVSKSEFMEIQSYYLSLIYLYIGVRADVTPMMIIYTKLVPSDNMNYLQYFNRKYSFILNEYKTSKTYGQKIIPVHDKELQTGLNEYVSFLQKYNKRKEGLRLFSNKSNSDFLEQSNLSTLYSSIFKAKIGKAFNIILNRKRIVSESDDVKAYLVAKEKVEKLADTMGHSVNVQTQIYDVNKPEVKVETISKPKSKRGKKKTVP